MLSTIRRFGTILTLDHRPLQLRVHRDPARPTLRLTSVSQSTTSQPKTRAKDSTRRTTKSRDQVSKHYSYGLLQMLTTARPGNLRHDPRAPSEAARPKTKGAQTGNADDPSPPTLPIPSQQSQPIDHAQDRAHLHPNPDLSDEDLVVHLATAANETSHDRPLPTADPKTTGERKTTQPETEASRPVEHHHRHADEGLQNMMLLLEEGSRDLAQGPGLPTVAKDPLDETQAHRQNGPSCPHHENEV